MDTMGVSQKYETSAILTLRYTHQQICIQDEYGYGYGEGMRVQYRHTEQCTVSRMHMSAAKSSV